MKKIIKKNYKIILGIIIGGIISGVGVYAATMISSSNISYDNSKSGLTSTNLNGAIDELYEKMSPCKVVSGTGQDKGDEIQCGTEYFNIVSQSSTTTKMLAKYPLEYGSIVTKDKGTEESITNPSYIQNMECGTNSFKGVEVLYVCSKSLGVLSLSSLEAYKEYLSLFGLSQNIEISYISGTELTQLGCSYELIAHQVGPSEYVYIPRGDCTYATQSFPWLSGKYAISIKGNTASCVPIMSGDKISCSQKFILVRPMVSIPTYYISTNK